MLDLYKYISDNSYKDIYTEYVNIKPGNVFNMTYTISSSEKTRSKASEFETKALLYLMNFRKDSDDIYYFVIDFFNDLTGVDRFSKKTWDLQSKAAKNNSQSAIGKELVTLFKNFISDFSFDYYILFIGGINDTIRKDKKQNIFNINNITDKSIEKIKKALQKESEAKTYINNSKITDINIVNFLNEVIFVIDDKEITEYIKSIVKVNPAIIPDDNVLHQIFNQIRDAQSSKKNNASVEGITISAINEFIYHSRHLDTNEIKLMVLNRIVNNDIMNRGVTISFVPIYSKFPEIDQKDILEHCQHDIAKTLFDKNNSENFWKLFNEIYKIVVSDKRMSVDDIFKTLNGDLLEKITYLDFTSLKYFIAIIKDSIHDN